MRLNIVSGGWRRNSPWATEIAFKKGFERLGHEVHVVDASDLVSHVQPADFSLVFKRAGRLNLADALRSSGHPTIVYQTDDMRFADAQQDLVEASGYCKYALLFEKAGVEAALGLGYHKAARVMLTADDELWRPDLNFKKKYGACFVGNTSNEPCHASRRQMGSVIEKRSMETFELASAQHMTRTWCRFVTIFKYPEHVQFYNQSKVALHHATDVGQGFGAGYGYQSRHFEAGLAGACVLSNRVVDEEPIPGLQFFSDEEEFWDKLKFLTEDDNWMKPATRFRESLLRDHRPEHRAQDVIDFVRSL